MGVNQRKRRDADAGAEVEVKAISTQEAEQPSTEICFWVFFASLQSWGIQWCYHSSATSRVSINGVLPHSLLILFTWDYRATERKYRGDRDKHSEN